MLASVEQVEVSKELIIRILYGSRLAAYCAVVVVAKDAVLG
jgi:hypothetical protein